MRYITQDGDEYEATNEFDLVTQMRKTSWTQWHANSDYMYEVAKHISKTRADIKLDCSSSKRFVAGLLDAKLLRIVRC